MIFKYADFPGSKFKFCKLYIFCAFFQELQNEVESLRSVVELKNQELRSLRTEKEELSLSVVSANESQTKIHNLTCQVEDLRELLEVKVRKQKFV